MVGEIVVFGEWLLGFEWVLDEDSKKYTSCFI